MNYHPRFWTFLGVICGFATAMPKMDSDLSHQGPQVEINDIEPDIEEIANREYETVHGRILAVNMAHWEKRKRQLREQEKTNINDTNVFKSIENVNQAQHLNGLYQGDIILDEELEELLHLPLQTRAKKNAISSRKRLWTSRIIPYTVPRAMMHIKKNLLIAIGEIQKSTCLRFVPYRPGVHKTYITFNNKFGCASKVGKKYAEVGGQAISLGDGCNWHGTIKHELLHALGFLHEQSRADRDKYVSIKWENILPGFSDQFDKYSWRTIDDLGMSYDYKSIMHYDRMAFTKNGNPTIVAVGNENMEFGTKDSRLSTTDIIELNALYDCQTKRYGWTKWSDFTPCNKKCYKTRERYCYHSGNPQQCGGNVNVYGIEIDKRKCTQRECLAANAINGHWGRWSEWSKCSATCDGGLKTRFRKCNNPAPGKHGKPCNGKSKETTPCTVGRCNLDYDDTDFDRPGRPLGMWRNKLGTKLRWTRHSGYTQTMNTGPSRDHTKKTGYGYYLYMESSGFAKPGDKAILTSPTLTANMEFQCLKFYYTMYGNTMGSLEVRLKQPGSSKKTIFYKRGNQGKPWHFGMATIQAKTKFSLEIVGTVGNTGYSDIAIDDVYIDDGKCSCQDKYINCIKWSAKGECKINEVWMKKHCQRSCHVCAGLSVCEDSNKIQCPLWANNGECSKNKLWMHKHCAKSCKICKASVCEDSSAHKVQCPLWAKKGECGKNKPFMHAKCRKSCGICRVSCEDSILFKSKCRVWASRGECTKNKKWMHVHCPKSCNQCT